MNRTHVLLFAYNPRQHGMVRERVPVELVEARVAQLKDEGWDVGHLPPGINLTPTKRTP